MTYFYQGGDVTLVGAVSDTIIGGPVNVALTGVSVTVDEQALTIPSLTFTVGSTGAIPISNYGAFTSFTLDFGTVSGTNGTLTPVFAGPPAVYGFNITVDLSGQFDATPGYTDAPFNIPGASGSGTIVIDPNTNQLELSSITIGAIDPDGEAGPLEPLLVKGDFIFVGLVPEPGTALLLGAGLAGLAAIARRREDAR